MLRAKQIEVALSSLSRPALFADMAIAENQIRQVFLNQLSLLSQKVKVSVVLVALYTMAIVITFAIAMGQIFDQAVSWHRPEGS